jgi:WD40 repeat protein
LNAHQAGVNTVAWSPDGSRFASGSDDHKIIIWDALTFDSMAILEGPKVPVLGLAWNPDGSLLASTYDWENSIIVWDVDTGAVSYILESPIESHIKNDIEWSNNGRYLAQITAVACFVWDLSSGEIVSTLQGHAVGITEQMRDMATSPGSSRIATSGDDRLVIIYDLEANIKLKVLEGGHTSPITVIKWSPDGSQLASSSGQWVASDNSIVLWDLTKIGGFVTGTGNDEGALGEKRARLLGHNGGINSLDWDPNGKILASGSDDKTIILWDSENGSRLAALFGHRDKVNSVAFNPDGTKLATGSSDNNVIIWDTSMDQFPKTLEDHSGNITSLVWNPKGNYLASGGSDASILIWDIYSGQVIQSIRKLRAPILGLAWSPDGSYLVSGTYDRPLYGNNLVWKVDNGEKIGYSSSNANGCGAVGWHPDGNSWFETTGLGVASLEADRDMNDPQYAIHPQERFGCVLAMDFSPKELILALGNEDGNVFLWDITENNAVILLDRQVEGISDVSWNHDGSRIAVAGAHEVVVFDAHSGFPIIALEGHTSVDWSKDGEKLLAPGPGNTAVIWDASSGQPIMRLAGHADRITRLAISPNGNQLVTGSADRMIRIINTRFLESPCKWALRNMSVDEWELYFPDVPYRRTCPELID